MSKGCRAAYIHVAASGVPQPTAAMFELDAANFDASIDWWVGWLVCGTAECLCLMIR